MPQFYLRRFADQKGRIRARRRASGMSFITTAQSIAVETDLYTVRGSDGALSDAAESILAEIDGRVAPAFARLVGGGWPPDHETRGLIANFIAIQATRTRESFQTMAAIYDYGSKLPFRYMTDLQIRRLIEETYGSTLPQDEVEELVEAMRDVDDYRVIPSKNHLVESMLRAASELVQPIADRRWFLERSKKRLIATSDSPVVLWSPPGGPYGVGVLTADEILLPIDPNHCLLLVLDSRGWSESVVDIPPHMAKSISSTVAASSYEWMFADPRGPALDEFDLNEARPVGTFGGEPMWGSSTGHLERSEEE